MSTGAFTLTDIDKPAGQFTAKDLDSQPKLSVDESELKQPTHWLEATGDTLKDLASGFGAGATQTITAVSKALNKIPGIGETLAPTAGIKGMEIAGTPRNTAEKFGAGIEQAAELMAGGVGKGALGRIATGALGSGASTAVHQAGTGQISPAAVGTSTVLGGGLAAAGNLIPSFAGSKVGRGLINESVMATPRDVAYGNPAKALLENEIATPVTGDLEKFKAAIRNGATLDGASQAAGGRIAAVSQKISELAPQLRSQLSAYKGPPIPATTITDAIDNGIKSIQNSRGITASDAVAAINELNSIKQAALKIPNAPGAVAKAWAPLEANMVKQEIGKNINWAGRERVGELVEPVRKQIYGNLKDAVNKAVPGTQEINEKLTNLFAAQEDVNKLAGFEEVGRGRSMGGVIGPSWMGRIEAMAGRYIPAAAWLSPRASRLLQVGVVPTVTQGNQ